MREAVSPPAAPLTPAFRTEIDERMMRHALALARRGLGNTWPNPAVGAVVRRMGPNGPVVVGRGFTQPGGRPHAEPMALAMAGEAARGASMAVTLEPCSHHGKTPPCVDGIIASGIARVVSAIEDPDPRVNGRGHIHLRAHGVEVAVGAMAREARQVNLGFIRRMVDGRPSVTVKLARTADGFAGRTGARLMITGETANARVHLVRAQHDVVVTGVGTVLADDPLLTCRLPGLEHRSPVRVVIDSALRTPVGSRMLRTSGETPVWIVCAEEASVEREAVLAEAGASIHRVPADTAGRVDLKAALACLARLGVTRALCEAGPTLAEGFAAAGLVDQIALLTSPVALAAPGLPALGPALSRLVDDTTHFELARTQSLGADRLDLFTRRS